MYELAVQRSEAPIIFSCRFRHVSNPSVKQEIGNSWYTIKVDSTKDPTGVENISIIIRFFMSIL